MENQHGMKKGGNGRNILYLIMIGFCILALIEIVYGRVQLKKAREQLVAKEEELHGLEQMQDKTQTADTDSPAAVLESEPEGAAADGNEADESAQDENAQDENVGNEETAEPEPIDAVDNSKSYDMQIVFLGDSILDSDRSESGVAALIGNSCNAKTYNMAMGGTTAALLPDERYDFNRWDSRSLLGVVNAIIGNIDASVFEGYRAGEILKECDFAETDYFVIEYGLNDYLSNLPNTRYLDDGVTRITDDAHTYVGALELAITLLRGSFPDAKIILCAPHYCQFFNGTTFTGDAYSMTNWYGSLISYANLCSYAYEQHKEENVILYNTLEHSGINAYTASEYLEDGIHLSEAGRRAYAEHLIQMIHSDFEPVE